MLPFVGVALKIQEMMNIADKKGQGIVMRFAQLYTPEKLSKIVHKAKSYYWWEKNPIAAFLKAIGETNKEEKQNGKPTT